MTQHNTYILRILMILIMMVMGVGEAWADTWDGATKYTTIATAGIEGAGTESSPYIIDNANKFVAFGVLAHNSTAYWKLTADIDLGGYEWPYAGSAPKTFKGHFDGDGHTVSNYTITPVTKTANGLFGTVSGSSATNRAEIKDLKIDNVTISTTGDLEKTTYIGALVGNASQYVDFKNVQIIDVDNNDKTVSIELSNITGDGNIGGLIGVFQKNSTIENCTVNKPIILVKGEGTTIAGTCYIGGAIGYMVGSSTTEVTKIDKPASGSNNGLTVNSPSVTVHKILSSWYIGSAIGRINNYSDVNYVTIDSPTLIYKAVGSPDKALYLGTFVGHIQGTGGNATTTPVSTPVKNIKITGTSEITIGTGSEEIKNVRAGVVGQITTNADIDTWNVATSNITVKGRLTTSVDYFGGVIGQVTSAQSTAEDEKQTKVDNVKLANSTITVTGNVVKESYIGSVFGRIEGSAGNASNLPKRTVVTNVTTTGATKVVFGSSTNQVSIANIRAGAIGFVGVNSEMSGCTFADTEIEVNGILETGASYLGGIIGLVQSSTSAYPGVLEGKIATKLDNITVKKSDVKATGNIAKESYVGGGFGRIDGVTSTTVAPQRTSVTGIKFKNDGKTGISKVTIGTNKENTINYVRTGVAGMVNTNVIIDNWEIENANIQINGNLLTTSSSIGGCIGYMTGAANAPVKIQNITMGSETSEVAISVNGDVSVATYIGGTIGYFAGNATGLATATSIDITKPTITINGNVTVTPAGTLNLGGLVGYQTISTISKSTVTKADIILNGNNANNMYVGGAVGWMAKTVAPFASVEKVTVKDSKIRTSGTPTYAKGNKALVVGGLVGYMDQNATNFCDVRNCVVDNIDINLSGYIPEAANTSGNLYNQQQNAFVVGGVIGRINTPSRLPEYLYFSGKINAPFAMVAPVVGVFLTTISNAAYAYDDYTGANAPNVANQWQKALTWYYTDYNLGLSSAVRTQTDRTKNYTASTTKIGDVEYLNITSSTLKEYNAMGNISKTVLRYDVSGVNRDFGLFPAWNTGAYTYPAYYMYYMQGVNRGQYVETGMAEATKSIVLNGMQYTLEFSQSTERSFAKTFSVSSTEPMDSYEWYINGKKQSETSNQYSTVFTIEQVADPNTNIYIYGIKDGKKVAMATGVPSRVLLRVKDESQDISTYGTKANPYVIGGTYGAQELQLLSYLSTLDNNIKWEGSFISSTHYNRAYYELESDIDMSGIADFTPISLPKSNNTDGTSSGYHQNFVFDGVFEGNHHAISGLNIRWYAGALNTNDQNMGWGLFAAVGNTTAQKKVGDDAASNAVIQNLIIEGATLTHKTDNTSFYYNNGVSGNANYCMVGVLAGIVGNNVTIKDIEIRNSKITDEGSRNYSLASKGLFVGGAIGSYQTGFNATNNVQANSVIQHIAAQVDITLTRPQIADVSAVTQLNQFNVGGIIGRYIATNATKDQAEAIMPKYTIYSGTVKTPRAWVSPVLGSLRYKDQNGNSWANYSKQYEGNNNSDDTQIKITNALYYNFYIDTDKITDAFPTNTCKLGSRTMSEHVDIVESAIMYNALKYQGVNYEAKYIDMEGASLEYLNESRTDGYNWLWDNGFVYLSTDPYVEAKISRDGNTFTASLVGAEAVSYTWKLSFDGDTWYDISGESSATYTTQESPKQKFIRAFISDGTKEYPTISMTLKAVEICNPTITYTDNSQNRIYTANLNVVDGADISYLDIEYQWYDWNHELISGATNPTYNLSMDEVNQNHEVVWCVITFKENGMKVAEYTLMAGGTVVYIDGTNGIDNVDGSTERGWTDLTPVKTIDHANSLLKSKAEGGTMDNNIIVVMGTLNPNPANFTKKETYTNPFQSNGKNPATLTGYYGKDYQGEIVICEYSADENTANPFKTGKGHNCYVLGDTKFENLVMRGGSASGNSFIECHGNDVTFGKGLVMTNFNNLSKGHGNLNTAQTVPEFTIILTATNLVEDDIKEYTTRTKPQVVTFQSGHYGRVMGGRYTNGFFSNADNTSHTILGSPKHPVWAVVNIEFDEDNEMTDGGSTSYTCDINCVIAGLTDGTMYGDFEINHYGGRVCYIVGGNQGNPVPNGTATYKNTGVVDDEFEKNWGQWPNASYFGRSVINIDQQEGLKNITIDNIYAGGLGREANGNNAKSIVDMYVYGQTEVNIKGGTVNSCVYAGGAGGVLGPNPWDAHAPYATTEPDNSAAGIMNGVQYGDTRVGTWSSKTADAALADVTLHKRLEDGTYEPFTINLANSSATINISGGAVNGDVYGGGFGQVEDMPAAVTMQGVGSVFGTSNIIISGGTITGSVYGGSRGSSVFYHEVNKYGQTIDHIAEMNGTINLTITGTEENYPYIKSAIYGAGRGLSTAPRKATQADVDAGKAANVGDTYTEEYPRIATAGNTDLGESYKTNVNITIDLPESVPFPNDIYGGGQMGLVDGSTNIILKRGNFTGSIYGGGYGEKEHLEKALITGDTHVSTGAADPTKVNQDVPVTFSGVNIFGGGDMAKVKGNTYVNINHGNITADVFGGGRGLSESESGSFTGYGMVTGDTQVLFNNATPDNALTGNIYGGGALGTVDGNTKIEVNVGEVNGNVFGGGLGEPTVVTGNVDVVIGVNGAERNAVGPTINGDVYGGSALGKVNGTVVNNDYKTVVTLNAGEINGSLYGGALGQKTGVNGATSDIAANVYGPVEVKVYGGNVFTTDGTGANGSGGVFGCNNLNGEPKNTVNVDIYGTNSHDFNDTPDDYSDDKYAIFSVYGGGNKANYSVGTPKVTVHNCDNSINYVYGGGNAADITHETLGSTNVTIWGGNIIGNVFGGGNGAGAGNPGANVSVDTNVAIHGGTIIDVYGGSNTLGDIGGQTNVTVLAQAEDSEQLPCPMNVTNVYGGGNKAPGKAGIVDIQCTGENGRIENVFGGANMADLTGDITLNIHGGNIVNAFGGNNNSGRINGNITVNVDWASGSATCGTPSLSNVYGGGKNAPYYAFGYNDDWTEKTPDPEAPVVYGPTVNLFNGTINNNVYGGGYGEPAVITGNPVVNLQGAIVTGNIFGGGEAAPVVGNPLVNAAFGTTTNVFAGGLGATAVVTGDPLAKINQTNDKTLTISEAVYGGGDAANVDGTAGVLMLAGTVKDIYGGGNAADVTNTDVIIEGGISERVFGGGHGNKGSDDPENPVASAAANVTENANVLVKGGTITQVFAAGNSLGAVEGEAHLTINKDNGAADLHIAEAYGGGNEADGNAGIVSVLCTGGAGESVGDVYGGARNAIVTGDITLNLQGGTITRAFGGNNVDGNVTGKITVNVNHEGDGCDLDLGSVYGGGNMAPYAPTEPGAYPEVNIISGTVNNDVFGGGLGATAIVTSNPVVNISGGTVGNNVFGGGSLAETVGDPIVTVAGGTVTHDVYGGGALADVDGNTEVNLTGGAVGGAYGGALGQLASDAVGIEGEPGYEAAKVAIAAKVNGNTTVTLNGTMITETGVFGANNLNGTPRGHAFVHVLSTKDAGNGAAYHVPAVYGGGNLSAYEPSSNTDFAEVLIENCDNSIEYVYGGGNAAPVPATKVVIKGANSIKHAFAGGNGAGQSTDPSAANYNPGADVGYLGYRSSGTYTEYGSGLASITVNGGTVDNVYGGSNTLGFIRGGTSVSVANEDGACPLNVGNVFGGGNEADIDCSVTINLDCNEGADILYAGANNANVNGHITLNISSGTFGQVFCGNNEGGNVKGNLVVNVDETGCQPVMIGELYACGNMAPYSVYGYDNDGNCITTRTAMTMSEPYNDPEINLISFTRIGAVFGGGYGATADLYGDTHVNVDVIPGVFADTDYSEPTYVLDADDNRVPNEASVIDLPAGVSRVEGTKKLKIHNDIGTIGNIYGGGNQATVHGNTHILIGTGAVDSPGQHVTGTDAIKAQEAQPVAATITGDVFGGGKTAIVTGNTHVTIGE